MNEDIVSAKLDTLIRLQAHLAVSQFDSQKDKILFLSRAGLPPKEIADILGTTSNNVNVALSTARKAGVLKAVKGKGTITKDEADGQ
jgi:DNA-directed RNA polymerase specialized sigma24 family protein